MSVIAVVEGYLYTPTTMSLGSVEGPSYKSRMSIFPLAEVKSFPSNGRVNLDIDLSTMDDKEKFVPTKLTFSDDAIVSKLWVHAVRVGFTKEEARNVLALAASIPATAFKASLTPYLHAPVVPKTGCIQVELEMIE